MSQDFINTDNHTSNLSSNNLYTNINAGNSIMSEELAVKDNSNSTVASDNTERTPCDAENGSIYTTGRSVVSDNAGNQDKGKNFPNGESSSASGKSENSHADDENDGSTENNSKLGQPSFSYDSEIFQLCQHYLTTKNHQGLALVARQKGLPPFLRFKIWPILLKHHPFVVNPFIEPDNEVNNENDTNTEEDLKSDIKRDLLKYIHRLNYTNLIDLNNASPEEQEVFKILESSILKFVKKWGKIMKYDHALTWIALGLAEWFPPIPNTSWVLVGRDFPSSKTSCIKNLFHDYSNYINNVPNLNEYLEDLVNDKEIINMSFRDVYERLVLVLLHAPEEKIKNKSKDLLGPKKINRKILPINGGTIEERVSFFIYCFRKLLPELSQYFQEEQILNKFGSHDDEWLIWWLKWCGSKVWSRLDRGRIWDLIFGWRLQNFKKSNSYYVEKLNLSDNLINKLGPDNFWSVSKDNDDSTIENYKKSSSFKDLINELNINESSNSNSPTSNSPSNSSINEDLLPPSPLSSSSFSSSNIAPADEFNIPFSKLDPHVELLFVTLALLKSKENTLMELDQHEIRQFLSRLPTKSINISNKYKHFKPQESDMNNNIISNDSRNNHKIDFMDNIINESGELWRKWLWSEMIDDN
ncbi:DEHA2F02838p [Debaryomyces hansenii CBS767]|uniref:Oxidant-induced cell-cycle arrest protein 5 n=1 Tax=Debaryomyces hansenii (strain ATCC 36239 / CBS 767 / BCRC 21394 / JCM 1990 / NBRC 0083 / IGC 2968) TaxID=284592 RepID=OCA5_DEBHA|nr:DEHA2F02838p [Debaryomyces hansenii CBS767]Q6BMT2.2 RecName: Full=Oxidant-induced cell-cycle arrest protein 5 [Debaryomyces hansenii CBS767]CAG88802.2 DEHA2F02838p [Debaryomyces hansenii CBS767]|eukprot:XP_460489.2 DEHA2F02838p [Debaryomyces hansenii CBS767]